jgi:cyclase
LVFLDIDATIENREPQYELIKNVASECFMPFAYGGGIGDIKHVKKILKLGAEKIIINSQSLNCKFIEEISEMFGVQSVVVSIDVKKNLLGKYSAYTHSGTRKINIDPIELAKKVEKAGAGEILVNSIDRDGTMQGYDIKIIKNISCSVKVPVIACGGAGKLTDFKELLKNTNVSAVAAGSMFVFHGPHRAVLINYPKQEELKKLFKN